MSARYRTTQIDLPVGEQLRITAGNRTVFVWRNKRGLHFSKGGYAKSPRPTPSPPNE